MIPNKSGRLLVTVIEAEGGGGGGRGGLASLNNRQKMIIKKKEKHSLTRKLVGYRNWRQWWCKKEGNKVLRKG